MNPLYTNTHSPRSQRTSSALAAGPSTAHRQLVRTSRWRWHRQRFVRGAVQVAREPTCAINMRTALRPPPAASTPSPAPAPVWHVHHRRRGLPPHATYRNVLLPQADLNGPGGGPFGRRGVDGAKGAWWWSFGGRVLAEGGGAFWQSRKSANHKEIYRAESIDCRHANRQPI